MKTAKKYMNKLMMSLLTFGLISATSFAQDKTDTKHDDVPLPKQVQSQIALEKEKIEKEIDQEIEQVDQTLYMLEVSTKRYKNKMNKEMEETLSRVETNLELYKQNLIEKKNLVEIQSENNWQAFKDQSKDWWQEFENDANALLNDLEDEFSELVE